MVYSDPNNTNSIVYQHTLLSYQLKTSHWNFSRAATLHLFNMADKGEKLQQPHCYHPFSDSRDTYLTKNHYENYSPKMVPTNPTGSWTNFVQGVMSLQLWRQGASSKVFETLNHYGVSQGKVSARGHVDRIGANHDAELKVWRHELQVIIFNYIYIYIYIYMGASHTLHSLSTISFMCKSPLIMPSI